MEQSNPSKNTCTKNSPVWDSRCGHLGSVGGEDAVVLTVQGVIVVAGGGTARRAAGAQGLLGLALGAAVSGHALLACAVEEMRAQKATKNEATEFRRKRDVCPSTSCHVADGELARSRQASATDAGRILVRGKGHEEQVCRNTGKHHTCTSYSFRDGVRNFVERCQTNCRDR